ncbi:MAG: hypothetical protein IPN47_16190 [Gemmatimonadetes bacterium]|nr:hypothetical protein [Gemmatimonadota bacterium]
MTEDEERGGLGASFTDLMTSLAVIFVLLTVVFINREVGTAKDVRVSVVKALQGSLTAAGVPESSVREDSSSVVVILPDSAFFGVDKSALLPLGRSIVQRLMPVLADTLCNDSYRPLLETVVVEGHTDATKPADSTEAGGRLYNLALSQRRSMEFVTVATNALLTPRDSGDGRRTKVFDCFVGLASATGRGQEQLLSGTGLTRTSAAQRRVILRIRLKTARVESVVGGVQDALPAAAR